LSIIILADIIFEWCGLSQIQSMLYGCVPIVSKTGGLEDTVKDLWIHGFKGTGIFLNDISGLGLLDAVERAFLLYNAKGLLSRVRDNGMARDASWKAAGEVYLRAYEDILSVKKM